MTTVPLDTHSNFCWSKKFSIVKRYEIFSKVSQNMASDSVKKYMVDNFGRVVHLKLTDLNSEEKAFLNQYNQISFEKMNHKFKNQLHCMKNKIGVFRDPIFSQSYPWIIPKFTLDCEKSDEYTKPNVFIMTQEFHTCVKPLDDRAYSDEMQFWQYKHYERFHVNDPSVTWGPNDLAMCNLLVDETHKKLYFVDNEGFSHFYFRKRDYFRYKVMSVINPNIGEYLTGKNSNTPYEVIENDWNMHDDVKVFFRRLFLYEKLLFNFEDSTLTNENILKNTDRFNSTHNIKNILFQNWFHHEGEKVMQMTDEYVRPKSRLQLLDRDKYPELFKYYA